MSCEHKEWIGKPSGSTPTHWQCSKCNILITASAMLIITEINKLRYQLLNKEEK